MDDAADEVDELVAELNEALESPMVATHQASALAAHLFLVTAIADADTRVAALKERFVAAVSAAGFGELMTAQLDYALRLSAADGELLFEEMHKLYSLLDEIYALGALGFSADRALIDRMEDAVRARFSRQAALASQVRKDKRYPWNQGRWWYQD